MDKSRCTVCVTGGAGFIGSSLVKKLLDDGYTVHATLRNLNDRSKVGLLNSFPNANTRLKLFEADLYKPEEFEEAIAGCSFVFHVATPLSHTEGYKFANTVEATVDAAKSICFACVRSGTVKRLIYTASVVAASPMEDDGRGYKDFMDETCWTPLNCSVAYSNDSLKCWTRGGNFSLWACGLVGGEIYHLPYTPFTVLVCLSQLRNDEVAYNALMFLEELIGKVPIVHIEDVCDAHIFCMETPSVIGRFLCASSYVSTAEIAKCYRENYPEFNLKEEHLNGPRRNIEWRSRKLTDEGFVYKYDMKMIFDDCISCAKKMGDLQAITLH